MAYAAVHGDPYASGRSHSSASAASQPFLSAHGAGEDAAFAGTTAPHANFMVSVRRKLWRLFAVGVATVAGLALRALSVFLISVYTFWLGRMWPEWLSIAGRFLPSEWIIAITVIAVFWRPAPAVGRPQLGTSSPPRCMCCLSCRRPSDRGGPGGPSRTSFAFVASGSRGSSKDPQAGGPKGFAHALYTDAAGAIVRDAGAASTGAGADAGAHGLFSVAAGPGAVRSPSGTLLRTYDPAMHELAAAGAARHDTAIVAAAFHGDDYSDAASTSDAYL